MSETDFNYQYPMADFMAGVQATVVQQPDYTGCGGHDLQDHGGHGLHSQVNIGLVGITLNFRNQE